MLFRFETEGLSERGAILATLQTAKEQRNFLESLDLRSSNMYSNVSEEEVKMVNMSAIVERVRSVFGESLRLLWRESVTGYDRQSLGIVPQDGMVDQRDDGEYPVPLTTPKDLYSPIQSVAAAMSNACSLLPKSSGRQRREFFPDSSEKPRLRPRLLFQFKVSGREQVNCLKLDGHLPYTPPSPIAMSD
jgi:hypothetical protein